MTLITWDDKTLSVGIELIDSQHKVLVGYINELHELINSKIDKDLSVIFSKLVDYTRYHFDTEEQYFERLNADSLKLHKLQHKHFMQQLNVYKSTEEIESISNDFLYFLLDWLVIHIQCEDKKFIQNNLK